MGAYSASEDRTAFIKPHRGDHILPNSHFFARLLRHAKRGHLAIRDVGTNQEKTYGDLLSDALTLRKALITKLPKTALGAIENDEEVYIGVLAEGGYEYSVTMLAVLALGAAVVPMTVALPVDEALHFVRKSRQAAIVSSTKSFKLAQSISARLSEVDQTPAVPVIAAGHLIPSLPEFPVCSIVISSDLHPSENKSAIVIFTSGTTGPPKGAAYRHGFLMGQTLELVDHFNIKPGDAILHIMPIHHATGVTIIFFPFLLGGACIEFRFGSFSAEWTWDRLRKGGLTFFSGVPTIYMRMWRYYDSKLASLPDRERKAYEIGARDLTMMCGTSALPHPVQDFWTKIRQGKSIVTRYGSTELGPVFKNSPDVQGVPDGSVGEVSSGVDLKLSDGDEGEILVKSPWMFSKYIFDPEATASSHTSDGYFKTGDIGRREGKYYFIQGRASQDIIKSGGYKISALDIEREILSLPYIEETMVVGVADDEWGQRVGAVISLRPGSRTRLSIDELRNDLRSRLASYKMPTLLRVVQGEIPKGGSGKVLKKILGPRLFPVPGWEGEKEVQVWRREAKL